MDNTARVSDAGRGAPVGTALRPALSKNEYVGVNPNEFVISADGRRLAFSESGLGTVRLWDADRADSLLAVPPAHSGAVARMWISPDGSRVSLVIGDKALSISVPRFEPPAESVGPLVRFLPVRRIDVTDGIEFVDQFEFTNNPDAHHRAFLAWKGFTDDPAAHPPGSSR